MHEVQVRLGLLGAAIYQMDVFPLLLSAYALILIRRNLFEPFQSFILKMAFFYYILNYS